MNCLEEYIVVLVVVYSSAFSQTITGFGLVMFWVKILRVKQFSTPMRPRELGCAHITLAFVASKTLVYLDGGVGA